MLRVEMSGRELYVLGTASQVPTRYRNHNGYFLRWAEHGLLFDPGEGTQRQMIRSELSVTNITQICITHFHGDHCLGLPGIIQRISLDSVPHEVAVHFPESGEKFFDRLRHASIFYDVAKLDPRPITDGGIVFENDDLTIETRRLSHSVDSWGYRLAERDSRTMLPAKLAELGIRGPDIGRLQRRGSIELDGRTIDIEQVSEHRPGQVFAFIMDTRMCDGALELARDADLLVCESTYLSDETELAHQAGHMTAGQAAELARDAGARKLVLSHFSQRYPDHNSFLEEAAPIHADCVAAQDQDVIRVPPRRDS
jgi:ribonuclease Z